MEITLYRVVADDIAAVYCAKDAREATQGNNIPRTVEDYVLSS